MSKKDFSSKLAEGIRRAKNEPEVTAAATPAKPAPKTEPTKSAPAKSAPASRSFNSAAKSSSATPWNNSHSSRIWPD